MKVVLLLSTILAYSNLFSQVNLQNGSVNYEVPIFSFTDQKSGLGTSISLGYSSGNGLIVSDRASNVGQNWSLLAGGSITRKQNGEPDDQNSTSTFPTIPNGNVRGFNESIATYDDNYQSFSYTGDTYSRNYIDNYFPNGYMYSEFPLDMVDNNYSNWPLYGVAPRELALSPRFRNSMDKRWALSRRALADRQQDVFIFNFNGIAGEFVIGRDGNPLLTNDAKLIIQKSTADMTAQNIRTRINQFTITTPDGVIYKFGAYELSEVMKFVELSSDGTTSFRKSVTSGEPTGKFTIQKWVLTEIINPATQEKIVFDYDTNQIDVISEKTASYQFTEGQAAEFVNVNEQRAKGQVKRLKNITYPDGHKVNLYYNTTVNRVDVPGDFPLTQVKVLFNNEEISSYNLSYGYFLRKLVQNYDNNVSESDKRFARLCLTEVQKAGTNITEPSYKFSYYTGSETSDSKDIVPPFDCMAQDHWGYYNRSTLVDNENATPSKEVLKDLTLYASTYRQPYSGAAKFGLLKMVENPAGGTLSFEYEQNDSKDADNPTVTKTSRGVRVFRTTAFDGVSTTNNIVTNYNYKLSDGTTSGWGYESQTYLNRKQIKIWNASSPDGFTKEGVLKLDITNLLGKMLVKQLASKAIKVAVKSSLNVAGTIGPSVLGFDPMTIIASYIISGLVDRLFVLFNPNDYLWTSSYNFYPYELSNPIEVNYSRVEVVNSSIPGGNGKIVTEFTAPANVRSEIPALAMPYSPKQRYASWKYGLLSKKLIYNQAGTLLNELTNTYSNFVTQINSDNHKSSKVEVVRPESASCTAASYNIPISDFSWEYYYPLTGRSVVASSVEKTYATAGIAQMTTQKTYNNDYLEKTISVAKSNGDNITVKNYYANDYNNISTAIQEMKAKNMLTLPISTETWLQKPNGSEYLLDGTIKEYEIQGNGEVKVKKVYKLETQQPLLKSLIGEQNPATLVRNATYFKEEVTFNYDGSGILTGMNSPDGKSSSKIYDYSNRLLTAEILNASKTEVAYTSFESDQQGSWVYDINQFLTNEFVLGNRCYHFSSLQSAITRSISSSKPYILSFWSKGSGITVLVNSSPVSPVKTVTNSVTGWVFNEFSIGGSSNINIQNYYGGAGNTVELDELRLYPRNARMNTVAVNPKLGKTAECDVNNRIIYYEYDGLGRLQIVRDDKMNILKKICYNFADQAEDCSLSNTANWMVTGPIRCKPCESNPSYTYAYQQRQERDVNPQSPTFNQIRWYDLMANHSCVPAVWQATGNLRCQVDANSNNTGYQESEERDINPCSPSYFWTRWTNIGINLSACPTVCNSSTCSGNDKKCVNGVCETGTWAVVSSVYKKVSVDGFLQWRWVCTWKYCFSDGSQSTYYQETINTSSCPLSCFIAL